MKNPCKSHTSTIVFPSPFSFTVQVCSCLLCPVMPSLSGIHLMGNTVGGLGGLPQHPMGRGCAGHLQHHQSHLLSHCQKTPPLSTLHPSLQLVLFLLPFFTTPPTILLLIMFSSLVPVLLHAHLIQCFQHFYLGNLSPFWYYWYNYRGTSSLTSPDYLKLLYSCWLDLIDLYCSPDIVILL